MDKFRIVSGGQAPQEIMDGIRAKISDKTSAEEFGMAMMEIFSEFGGEGSDKGDDYFERFKMAYQ